MVRRPVRTHASALALAALTVSTTQPAPADTLRATSATTAPPAPTTVRIDGRFDDWRADAYLAADQRYLYVRLVLPEERTLQAAPQPLVVSIAADEHASAAARFDPDLRITFSPPASDGQGVAVDEPGLGAGSRALAHAALDLVVAPTIAAREFELRIARDVRGRPDLTAALAAGRVRVQLAVLRSDGSPAWRSRVRQLELPPRVGTIGTAMATPDAATEPGTPAAIATPAPAGESSPEVAATPAATPDAVVAIPVAGAGEIRVVSWNVFLP